MIRATLHEQGNGFPAVGAVVRTPDGVAHRVVAYTSRILTEQWQADRIHVELEPCTSSEDGYPVRVALPRYQIEVRGPWQDENGSWRPVTGEIYSSADDVIAQLDWYTTEHGSETTQFRIGEY